MVMHVKFSNNQINNSQDEDISNLPVTRESVRRRQWHPTPVLLPGKSNGWRSLVGSSPWGRRVWHDWVTSLSRIGEGNGNPLQCSCLENPRDGGAWWAAIYGVAQSQTWLKRLSSSSSRESVVHLSFGSLFENQPSSLILLPVYFHMFILGNF